MRHTPRFMALLVAMTLFIGPAVPIGAAPAQQAPKGEKTTALEPRIVKARETRAKRITQSEREAAAARLKLQMAGESNSSVGAAAAPESAAPAPGPGGIPDYFGSTPNWAYSPTLRKFVDSLPGVGPENANNLGQYLAVGHPDTVTYPGTDYYEIEVRQYSEQMHSDMPATLLRGYVQVNKGTDALGLNTVEPDPIHYLGPTILARKGRPVRVKFTNKLPSGAGGDLFLPVDKTYMGAGKGPNGGEYSQNRATIHLHGGKTVWISDGTPHQWVTPASEDTTYPAGVSVQNVPDMPDPGDGSMTFFYSNEQSARMLWYHDHAYGITRLNVLAGMAGGYFLSDETEDELIENEVLPADQIPLIIQDKTFVDASTIATTDPTWNWGSTPGTARTGDLWFPHVYVPAQNPADVSGVNPMGRWHYGPWFWPPTVNIDYPPVANPYYDPINAPWENALMPGTPNVSSGMEAFNDTPLVNGTAYPVMTVEPKAYRFRILNAANDRFFNLQTYVADPAATSCDGRRFTEVRMVDAAVSPDFPADWPTDGREGGVPDPNLQGPEWIQVGTEGGFLPTPVVVPNQPITWVTDVTLFNAGNVDKGSLILGPAERADAIVDFSKYAGKTLILYNDAPAAFPAGDPRYDYYTGAPDMTDTGGHSTPKIGYGPNTRTIMQIKVADAPAAPAYDMAKLMSAFKSTNSQMGVFEKSQNKIIVPNNRYNDAYNENFPTDAYVRIADQQFTFDNLDGNSQTVPLQPKAIQDEQGETFDPYGRMSGKLGLERPTGIPGAPNFMLYNYLDPTTEKLQSVETTMVPLTPVMGDGTQIWKITHNGVDTHPMHFHLYDVQVINRVGWDGFLRYPADNELGWKDTVRVSPLEDTIVALRPVIPKAPFNVPDSWRPLDPTQKLGESMGFSTMDPVTGQPYVTPIVNETTRFFWEYVWHCHILSHEEMEMMRPVTVEVTSVVPAALSAEVTLTAPGAGGLSWVDPTPGNASATWGDLSNEIGFRVERATVDALGDPGPFGIVGSARANETSFVDTGIEQGQTYQYRVVAHNIAGETTSTVMQLGPVTDTTGPLTTSSIDPLWHQSPYAVTLDATDTLSGVVSTSYTVDSGATQVYGAPFNVSGQGLHTVQFWSQDTSGNVEPARSMGIKIDDIDPATTDNHASSYVANAAITLSATDAHSGVRSTRYSLDGAPAKVGTSVKTSVLGSHTLSYWSVDAAGNAEGAHNVSFSVTPPDTVFESNSGAERIATALEVSRATFADGSAEAVIIASSDSWPDALVGSSLAGAHYSPILLTKPAALSAGILAEVDRLGAKQALILGGRGAISLDVEASLRDAMGTANVTRLGGADRYETARLIADKTIEAMGCRYDGTAFIANGQGFPDALGGAPLAAANGWPIYLSKQAGLTTANGSAMTAAGVTDAIVLGGVKAVPAVVVTELGGLGITSTRLGGATRYSTATLVATYGVDHAGLTWDGMAMATGEKFPDGLSAGAAQGSIRSVLVLTRPTALDASVAAALDANRNEIRTFRFIGGTSAISNGVRSSVAQHLN